MTQSCLEGLIASLSGNTTDPLVRKGAFWAGVLPQDTHEEIWDMQGGAWDQSLWYWCRKSSRQNPPRVGAGMAWGFAGCCPHVDTDILGKEVSDGRERWAGLRKEREAGVGKVYRRQGWVGKQVTAGKEVWEA